MHTSAGDVHVRLMPEVAPRAVENWCGHSRSGYYDGLLFHRVIKGFMVQTGDPNGDGSGGASIWGAEFEDEVDRSVRFDRPGVLAMANAGPCTNGSQFFITCAPCGWLDGKHTIFGRCVRGGGGHKEGWGEACGRGRREALTTGASGPPQPPPRLLRARPTSRGDHPHPPSLFTSVLPCSVTRGMDVVRAIETCKTDKNDRPLEDIKILSIDVK